MEASALAHSIITSAGKPVDEERKKREMKKELNGLGLTLMRVDFNGRRECRAWGVIDLVVTRRKALTRPAAQARSVVWLWDVPELLTLDAESTVALRVAAELGLLPTRCVRNGYSAAFSGRLPGWLWRLGVAARNRWVWESVGDDLAEAKALSKHPISPGFVWYDSTIKHRGPPPPDDIREAMSPAEQQWVSKPDDTDAPSTLIAKVLRACQGSMQHSRKWLKWAYPCTSVELAKRETYDVVLATSTCLSSLGRLGPKLMRAAMGLGSQCVSRLLLYAASCEEGAACVDGMLKWGAISRGLLGLEKGMKPCHQMWRTTNSSWCPHLGLPAGMSPDKLMYAQLLSGRYDFTALDVTEGLLARQELNPPKVTATAHGPDSKIFAKRMEMKLSEDRMVASTAIGKRGKDTLTDLLVRYSQYAATGSCKRMRGNLNVVWQGVKHEVDNPNKLAWLSNLSPGEVVEVVYELEEGIKTTGVRKTESGKLRLLLPGPEAHWLAETLALLGAERSVFRHQPEVELERSRVDDLRAAVDRLSWVQKGMSVAAEDFDDFNIVHDLDTMSHDYMELARSILCKLGSSVDRVRELTADMPLPLLSAACAIRLSEAMHTLEARDVSEPDEWYKLARGLWTGWRSTMWFNTRFNRAYSYAVQRGVEDEYGFNRLQRLYLVGDDSLLASYGEYEAMRRLEAYDLSGLKSQASKQMIDDEQAELTRIMHRADGRIVGSLVRAICNGASSDFQSSATRPGIAMAQALKSQHHMWARRGMKRGLANQLLKQALKYWVHMRVPGADGKMVSVPLPTAIMEGALVDGGLGAVGLGVVARRLRLPLLKHTGNFSAELEKRAAEQWDLRNPKMASGYAWSRFQEAGFEMDAKRARLQLEASVLQSNTPDGLTYLADHAASSALAESVAVWVHSGGNQKPWRHSDLNVKWTMRAWGAAEKCLESMTDKIQSDSMSQDLRSWVSPWAKTSAIEAHVLGPVASAPGILDTIKRRGVRVSKARVIARMAIGDRSLQDLFGTMGRLTTGFLQGQIVKPQSVGLVAPKHSVLVDLALAAAMQQLLAWQNFTWQSAYLSTGVGHDLLTWLSARIEWWVARHPLWGAQQGY